MLRTVSRSLLAAAVVTLLLLPAASALAMPAGYEPSWGEQILQQVEQWLDHTGLAVLWGGSGGKAAPSLDPNGLAPDTPTGTTDGTLDSDAARSGQEGDTLPNLDPNG